VAGDFNKKELEDALNKSTITGDALDHYAKHAPGKRAIMFEVSIARSLDAVARFKAAGIRAEHVDGDTDPAIRDAAMSRFISGETLVLSNVDLFGEGVDVPAVEVLIDCAPTMSLTRVMQRWGRVLRPADGKTHAVILDHAGNSKRHGLPDDDREWSLDGQRKSRSKKDDGDIAIKSCPMCFSVVRSTTQECRHCGHVFLKKEREIEQVDGDLQEIDREAIRQQQKAEQGRAATLEELIRIGTLRGYKRPELWARHVYRARQTKRAA
jgi:superfamily II DNA or RNA helicase